MAESIGKNFAIFWESLDKTLISRARGLWMPKQPNQLKRYYCKSKVHYLTSKEVRLHRCLRKKLKTRRGIKSKRCSYLQVMDAI